MEFEELTLRPASGTVDRTRVAAWLDARPHAYRESGACADWHLCTTARAAAAKRVERREGFALGVRVLLFPDRVVVAAVAGEDELSRALELVAWLSREGDWTVAVDRGAPEPLGDPRRLFPPSLPDPRALDAADATASPVLDGTRVTWTDAQAGTELVAHSGGAWRLARAGRRWHGDLTGAARERLFVAVASVAATIDEQRDALPEERITLEIEDVDGIEYIHVDPGHPPAACHQVVALVSAWLEALDRWSPGIAVDGLATIHETT